MRQHFAATERVFQAWSLSCSSWLFKVWSIFKASRTLFVDVLAWNRLVTSLWQWNCSISFSMYSIVDSVCYQYCVLTWKYTPLSTNNGSSKKGIIWLAEGFERVTTKSWTITRSSAIISLTLNYITWLCGLLNCVKPRYVGIIAQCWLNLSILECCLRKGITQSIKWLSIQW